MSDLTEIQRLIRLKRYESPPEDFVENFIDDLRDRQRAELLKRSSLELLFERVSTFFEPVSTPQWAMAGVAVAAVALMLMASLFTAPEAQVVVQTIPSVEPGILETPRIQTPKDPVPAALARSDKVVGPVADEFNLNDVLIGGPADAEENQTVLDVQLLSKHFNSGDYSKADDGWFSIGLPTRDMLLPSSYSGGN